MKVTNLQANKDQIVEKSKEFAEEIAEGLSERPKRISSKYLYNDKGSQIFQEITKLDEYYVTRTEEQILASIRNILPHIIGEMTVDIIELGVGDGHKSKIIIESFLENKINVQFYPIDISKEALNQMARNFTETKSFNIHCIIGDYNDGLRFVRKSSTHRQIVLFLGSNIGNFTKEESLSLIKNIRSCLNPNDFMLIGFDLKKDIDILIHAYSDQEGTTARFNLNILERINEELYADFNVNNFFHEARYNQNIGAMESFLISKTEQSVYIRALDRSFNFTANEPIHMEYSFKYSEQDIEILSTTGGFKKITNFTDGKHFFIDSLWQAQEPVYNSI